MTCRGLIPAHAGKTPAAGPWPSSGAAHPRSRGENKTISPIASRRAGSSPLTRGKRFLGRERASWGGLIPAHAGKTLGGLGALFSMQAHPRSRGENPDRLSDSQLNRGSSPLTRGKPCDWSLPGRTGGLIPAHAGKTLSDLRFYRTDRSDLGKP